MLLQRGSIRKGEGGYSLLLHYNGEPEGRTSPFGTLCTDTSPHQFRQPFADSQPQSGAAIFARGGTVSLGEWLEYMLQFIGRNADTAVAHQKTEGDGAFIFGIFHGSEALRSLWG